VACMILRFAGAGADSNRKNCTTRDKAAYRLDRGNIKNSSRLRCRVSLIAIHSARSAGASA
jgi:hypothetical protein